MEDYPVTFDVAYPDSLYGFMVGVNRWNARVSAYGSFLVDRYPPFSLR